jgi:predicted ATPase/DNA-binding SARP family transcriptional activator
VAHLWRIEMLGGLRAVHPDRIVTRFRTRKAGGLLGYLAFYPHRAHSRDELIEIFWPEVELDSARDRLRVALSSLRRQLEPPDVPPGGVIRSDRLSVRLNPAACVTDVAEFEAALRSADRSTGSTERVEWLARGVALYQGALLPDCPEMWVLTERQRLAGLFFAAIAHLVRHLEEAGELRQALDYAGRAACADPLREEAQGEFIRLLARAGQPTAALEQYRHLEQRLQQELNERPSEATRRLVAAIEKQTASASALVSPLDPRSLPAGRASSSGPPRNESSLPGSPSAGSHPPPPQATRFFGRELELARLRQLLLSPETRLVTVTGPGGSGKTRLVIEMVEELLETRQQAVWWVALAGMEDARSIADAVRDAMRLLHSLEAPALEAIVSALTEVSRSGLLVLDNFEHLIDSGGALRVHELLERVPTLQCLVTSRQLLNLGEEREFPLSPLPVPTGQISPAELCQNESVKLFVDRAQAVRPAFQVTSRNAPAVAELCRRLDGIPLAIELAAAYTRLLAPEQMVRLLARRFDFLTSRRRDLPSRHRTLRAAIDGSYQLLPADLQRFFARLSVFRGGWSLEAAAAVAGAGPPQGEIGETLNALAELRDRSLIQTAAGEAELRYQVLETLREHGAEQLSVSERSHVAERHARYFMALAEEAEPHLGLTPERDQWLDRLEQEHDNLRAAISWCAEAGDAEVGLRLAGALRHFWWWLGYLHEGREHLKRLLALPGATAPTAARAKAVLAAGQLAATQSDADTAEGLLGESVAIHRELGDRRRVAVALGGLASLVYGRGDYPAARARYEETLAIFRDLGDRGEISGTLNNLAVITSAHGDFAAAWRFYEESAVLHREIGNPEPVWVGALIAFRQDDLTTARTLLERCLTSYRERSVRESFGQPLHLLALVSLAQGEPAAARALLEEFLPSCRTSGNRHRLSSTLSIRSVGTGTATVPCGLFCTSGPETEIEKVPRHNRICLEYRGSPTPHRW